MRKQWLTGFAVVSLVGCVVGSVADRTGGNTAPTASGTLPNGGYTVEEINRALDTGHTIDQTTFRVAGGPNVADFRVQTQIRMAQAAKAGTLPKVAWNVVTPAPIRATPAAYGLAFGTLTNTDLVAFATDDGQAAATAGITSGVSNGCTSAGGDCSAATQFILSDLYETTTPEPHVAGWGAATGNHFELGALMFSFNPNAIELYSLAFGIGNVFCFKLPAAPAGNTGYLNTTNNLAGACNGWKNTSPISVGKNSITWSAPFPAYDSSGNITNFYYGDDKGNLQCVTDYAGADGGAAAPAPCPGYGASGSAGQLIGSVTPIAPPVVTRISSTENLIFVGDSLGNFWRIDDNSGALTKTSYSLGTGATFAIHGGAALDYTTGNVFIAAGGKMYQFPSSTTGTWAPTASVTLFTGATAPVDGTVTLDSTASGGGNFIYVSTNNTLFKVAYPLSGTTSYSDGLFNSVASSFKIDGNPIAAGSEPLGYATSWKGTTYIATGNGSTTSGGLEEYSGCSATASDPVLTGMSNGGPYGVLSETGLILDNAAADLYFGYDTGASTGGLVSYPLPATTPSAWACPTGTTSTAGAACGAAGCVPPTGCFNDSECAGTPSTPACDVATHTCVQCTTTNTSACVSPNAVCNLSGTFGTQNTCVGCLADSDCSGTPSTPHCQSYFNDSHVYTCVACAGSTQAKGNADCTTPGSIYCQQTVADSQQYTCVGCIANSDCGVVGNGGSSCETRSANADELALEYTCVACNGTNVTKGNCANKYLCNQETGIFFDTCIGTSQTSGTACTTNAKCLSKGTESEPGLVPLDNCDSSATSPMDQFCVQCDQANQTCASGSCDLTSTDSTFDTCVTCLTPNNTDATSGCADTRLPVCSNLGSCVQCPTVGSGSPPVSLATADSFCPGHSVNSGDTCVNLGSFSVCTCDLSDANPNSECPGGAGAKCCTNATDPGCTAGGAGTCSIQ